MLLVEVIMLLEFLRQIGLLNPPYLWGSTIALFVIIFVRYLVVSKVYHNFFFHWNKQKFKHRVLNTRRLRKKQSQKEIYWSAIGSAIFTVLGMGLIILWQRGHTAIYTELDAYPLWYLPISILLVLFIHDTYYYWVHRWMHLPRVYRSVHRTHHMSVQTTAHTSFSFHPLESLLQAIAIPLLVVWLPINIWAVMFILLLMTLSATINHAGVEIYPSSWGRHWLGKWIIGAAHHDDHHKKFTYNYGLYFTFWDKWMGTETPDFEERFEILTSKKGEHSVYKTIDK